MMPLTSSSICLAVSSEKILLKLLSSTEISLRANGSLSMISGLRFLLKVKKIRAVPLKVSHPFHSRHMSVMLDTFKSQIENIKFSKPKTPIISNITAKIQNEYDEDYFAKHIISPVHFTQSIDYIIKLGNYFFLECGPAPILSRLIRKDFENTLTLSSCEKNDPSCLSIYDSKEECNNLIINGVK